MKQPKVSVIMPVYNTGAYLDEAIQSVVDQELKDWELIVINDGSTDDSLAKLEVWTTDRRILLISQTNQGPSAARNKGLKHATGQYVYFLDSDDLILPKTLSTCYSRCEDHGLDFVFFDAASFSEKHTHFMSYERGMLLSEEIKSGLQWFREQLHKDCFRVPVWLNFIRLSHLRTHQLYFENMLHEDEVFTPLLYCYSRRVGFVAQQFNRRRLRDNSIMTSDYTLKNYDYYLQAVKILLGRIPTMDTASAILLKRYVKRMLNAAVWRAHRFRLPDKFMVVRQLIPSFLFLIEIDSLIKLFFKKK